MRRPRISVGWLMFGVAMACIPSALVGNAMNGRSLVSGNGMYDLGLWPGLVAFSSATFASLRSREGRRPFSMGFAATGWISLLAYVAACRWRESIVQAAILFYVNDLGDRGFAWLTDLDTMEGYVLNLLLMGLMLATPQLVAATVGGLVARRIGGARWTST